MIKTEPTAFFVDGYLVLPDLAAHVGLNPAVFMQHLHFLLMNEGELLNGRIWVKDTSHEDWAEIFPFWSVSTIKRVINFLRDTGLIDTTNGTKNRGGALWYSINYSALEAMENE